MCSPYSPTLLCTAVTESFQTYRADGLWLGHAIAFMHNTVNFLVLNLTSKSCKTYLILKVPVFQGTTDS